MDRALRLKIVIGAIVSCLIWGSALAFAKIGFEYMPPIRLSGYRFMIAGLMLLPVLLVQRYDWRELKGKYLFIFSFAMVQTFLQYGLFYYGLNMVPAAISAIIIGGGPFFIAILAHLTLKEDKLSLRKSVSIAFGLSGVVFISLKNGISLTDYPALHLGIGVLILSNIIGSFSNIMVVKFARNMSSIALTACSSFIGGVLLLLLSFIVEPEGVFGLGGYSWAFYGSLLWLAFIPASAFSLWYYLLQQPNVKVSELNIWKFLIPVFGILLSWLILDNEVPNLNCIIGVIVISMSIIVLQTGKK